MTLLTGWTTSEVFQMLISRQTLQHLVVCGCEFFATPTGGGEQGSPQPRSSGFVNDGRGYFEGRGIAHLPSSSHPRDGLLPRLWGLRRRKDWHLSLPPRNAGEYFGGGGTGPPPHNAREYLGGGKSGLPPRTVGVYFMSMVEGNDELNILHSQTYRTVTVEGDQQIVTSAVRQSDESFDFVQTLNSSGQDLDLGEPREVMQSLQYTQFLSGELEASCNTASFRRKQNEVCFSVQITEQKCPCRRSIPCT